jgi:predicted dehydrogenase
MLLHPSPDSVKGSGMTGEGTLRAAMVGLRHSHCGTLDPARPGGLLGTLRQLPGVELVALCEPADAERLARERAHAPAVEGFRSVEALLEGADFDLAMVALPAVEVPPAATRLLRAGKHCLLEKTVARTAEDFLPVLQAAKGSGAHVQVHFPWRYHPAVRQMRALLDEGLLGRPTALAAQMVTGQVGPLTGQREARRDFFRWESEGGGMLHYLGGHLLEIFCYLLGDVEAVSAVCAGVVGNLEPYPTMDDVSSVSLKFANGAVGTFHTGYLQAAPDESRDFVQLWGTEGSAYWPTRGPRLSVSSRAPAWSGAPARTIELGIKARPGVYGEKEWLFGVARDFVEGIRGGRPPEVGAREALRVLRITDAAYEASRTRRWASLETVEEA